MSVGYFFLIFTFSELCSAKLLAGPDSIFFFKPLKIFASDEMISLVALLKPSTSLDQALLSVFLTDGVQHKHIPQFAAIVL